MPESWKATLPCTRVEAEVIALLDDPFSAFADPPVLMVTEPDPARPGDWRLDVYCAAKPDAAMLAAVLALVPSARRRSPKIERLPDADWLTLSQAGMAPLRAGRFYVHTSANVTAPPTGTIPFRIEAGRAFGTGHHETTAGCLLMLDRMKRQGARFSEVLDVGTGTGLLAFAALALWPRAHVIASDIDPTSTEVAAENAAVNGVPIGFARGRLGLVIAPGLAHPLLEASAPYDLIVANILAAPLIELAPAVAAATAPRGSVVLAGLLDHQASAVAGAYRRHGFRLADRIERGEWPTLRMRKRS